MGSHGKTFFPVGLSEYRDEFVKALGKKNIKGSDSVRMYRAGFFFFCSDFRSHIIVLKGDIVVV